MWNRTHRTEESHEMGPKQSVLVGKGQDSDIDKDKDSISTVYHR